MIRRPTAVAFAALSTLATLAACSGSDASTRPEPTTNQASTATTPPTTPATPRPGEPTDLKQFSQDTALVPGRYAMPLLMVQGPVRAVVDVPAGYFAWGGGGVIGSMAVRGKPDNYGDVAFWGRVTQVAVDPCLGGPPVDAGTSVHDLVTALRAQRHVTTTRPAPVTIGGYSGVHVKITAPADIAQCRGGSVRILSGGGTWLQADAPGAVFHEWILNVGGRRVVAGARILPELSNPAELVDIVESASFAPRG